jgi:hypothetical protein
MKKIGSRDFSDSADVYFPGEMVDGLKIVPVSTIGACAQLLKQGLANRYNMKEGSAEMRRGKQVHSNVHVGWGGGGGEGQCLTCYEGSCYFHLLITFFFIVRAIFELYNCDANIAAIFHDHRRVS